MEIAGYIACIIVGISLGLIGGGGSILMVPILVYLFKIDPENATAYSLFVVGVASVIGAYKKARSGNISFSTALVFGIPSLVTVFITRAFVVPAIPYTIFRIGNFKLEKPVFLMLFFSLIMIVAAFSMIKKQVRASRNVQVDAQTGNFLLIIQGIFVGFIAGIAGAGGGFLIVPALVLISKLNMKKAIGTSLLIIAVQSLIGFTGDLSHRVIDWKFLIIITALASTGMFIGNGLGKNVDAQRLRKWFGWFVLMMGTIILLTEIYLIK